MEGVEIGVGIHVGDNKLLVLDIKCALICEAIAYAPTKIILVFINGARGIWAQENLTYAATNKCRQGSRLRASELNAGGHHMAGEVGSRIGVADLSVVVVHQLEPGIGRVV